MNPIFSTRLSLTLSVLAGLLAGALFAPPIAAPIGFWQVQVSLSANQPPIIESAHLVTGARPILLETGQSVIQLLSDSGQVLVQQTFQPSLGINDLPGGSARVPYIFTLPDQPGATTVLIRTPQGEMRYELRR
jgi:hypothetical protein